MKEKETVTVVCSHCGQTKQPTGWLFREQWERSLFMRIQKETGRLVDRIFYSTNTFDSNGEFDIPIPQTVIEWMDKNPCPKISRQDYIVSLAERVSALEAALAEKGGAK